MVQVVKAYPPNFTEIVKRFPAVKRRLGVIFAYGDRIYNPSGVMLPPEIMAHETVHCERQSDPVAWWARYFEDREFRLEEELLAYHAEYVKHVQLTASPLKREFYLAVCAEKMASPIYDFGIQDREVLAQAVKRGRFD